MSRFSSSYELDVSHSEKILPSNCEIATPSLQSETLSYPTPQSFPSPSIEDDDLDPGFYVLLTKPESFHASVGPVVTFSDEAQAIHNSKPEHLNHMADFSPYLLTARMDVSDMGPSVSGLKVSCSQVAEKAPCLTSEDASYEDNLHKRFSLSRSLPAFSSSRSQALSRSEYGTTLSRLKYDQT